MPVWLWLNIAYTPYPSMSGGRPHWSWTSNVAPCLATLLAAVCWAVSPFAIGLAFGPWWTLIWLLPTTFAVFSMALAPQDGG